MDETIQNMASLTVVLTFIGCVFSYFVLRPLYSAIGELRITIRELRDDIRIHEERRHAMEIKLAEVDQSTRSAHHRIDTLQKQVIE